MPEQELREVIARVEHDRWARWQQYFFSKCERNDGGDVIVPAGYVAALQALIDTSYDQLTQVQKDQDRAEADETIAALVARVPDGIPAAVERYGVACMGYEFDRIYTLVDDDCLPRRKRSMDAAERDLLALVAVARPGVTITKEMVSDIRAVISSLEDAYVHSEPGSDIGERIEGVLATYAMRLEAALNLPPMSDASPWTTADESCIRIEVGSLEPVINFFGYHYSEVVRLGKKRILIELSEPVQSALTPEVTDEH